MRSRTMISLLSLALAGLILMPAFSNDKVGCDEIQWKQALLAGFADIDKACQGVVIRDGKRYVHFEVRLVRATHDGNVKVAMTLRDGQRVERIFHAPSDFDVLSHSGKTTFNMDELDPGDVLDVYIPESRIVAAKLGQNTIQVPVK